MSDENGDYTELPNAQQEQSSVRQPASLELEPEPTAEGNDDNSQAVAAPEGGYEPTRVSFANDAQEGINQSVSQEDLFKSSIYQSSSIRDSKIMIDLRFTNVKYSVEVGTGKNKHEREILHGLSGYVHPGEVMRQ